MPNTVPAAHPGLPTSPEILDLDSFPDQYGMICDGACLEPDVPDGSILAFSKSEPYAAGDIVVVYFRPELVRPGRRQGIVKRLVMAPPPWVTFPWRESPQSDVHALILVEMTNPRRQFTVPCSELLAIHRCLGIIPKEMTEPDRRRSGRRDHA